MRYEASVQANIAGCVASQGNEACGRKLFASSECFRVACPGIDVDCFELALSSSCKSEHEESKRCEAELREQPAFAMCFSVGGSFRGLLDHFCGK